MNNDRLSHRGLRSLFSSVSLYIQVIIDTYLTLIQNFIWVHKVACSFFFNFISLSVWFWLHLVFVAVRGLF